MYEPSSKHGQENLLSVGVVHSKDSKEMQGKRKTSREADFMCVKIMSMVTLLLQRIWNMDGMRACPVLSAESHPGPELWFCACRMSLQK